MEMEALVVALLFSSGFAVIFLGIFAWGLVQERRAHRDGCEPRPGLRAATDWSGSIGFLFAILASVALALLGGRQEGFWRIALLVAVNLVIQPLCFLMLVSGVYQIGQALRGRATYAFRVIPRENLPGEEYRALLHHR